MIKNPWKRGELGIMGDGTLWTSGWTLHEQGVKLYLARDTGAIAEEHTGDTGTTGAPPASPLPCASVPRIWTPAAWETVTAAEAYVNDGEQSQPGDATSTRQMHSCMVVTPSC